MYLDSPNRVKILVQQRINLEVIDDIIYILFVLKLQNLLFIFHLQHVLVQTSHTSNYQEPLVAMLVNLVPFYIQVS